MPRRVGAVRGSPTSKTGYSARSSSRGSGSQARPRSPASTRMPAAAQLPRNRVARSASYLLVEEVGGRNDVDRRSRAVEQIGFDDLDGDAIGRGIERDGRARVRVDVGRR